MRVRKFQQPRGWAFTVGAMILAAITELVEELRDERAPVERFDPKRAAISETGNPHKHDTQHLEAG